MTLPAVQPPNVDEAAVRGRIPQRDRAAWDWVYQTYGAALERQARLLSPSSSDAADAVSDTFVVAFDRAARYDPRRSPWPWLARICVRVCLKARRHRRVRAAVTLEDATAAAPRGSGAANGFGARAAIHRALGQLARRRREVLALRFLFGVSVPEIAELLGVRPGAVERAIGRGLDDLRRCGDAPELRRWMLAYDEGEA